MSSTVTDAPATATEDRKAQFDRLIDMKLDEFVQEAESSMMIDGDDDYDLWKLKREADLMMDLRDRVVDGVVRNTF